MAFLCLCSVTERRSHACDVNYISMIALATATICSHLTVVPLSLGCCQFVVNTVTGLFMKTAFTQIQCALMLHSTICQMNNCHSCLSYIHHAAEWVKQRKVLGTKWDKDLTLTRSSSGENSAQFSSWQCISWFKTLCPKKVSKKCFLQCFTKQNFSLVPCFKYIILKCGEISHLY